MKFDNTDGNRVIMFDNRNIDYVVEIVSMEEKLAVRLTSSLSTTPGHLNVMSDFTTTQESFKVPAKLNIIVSVYPTHRLNFVSEHQRPSVLNYLDGIRNPSNKNYGDFSYYFSNFKIDGLWKLEQMEEYIEMDNMINKFKLRFVCINPEYTRTVFTERLKEMLSR